MNQELESLREENALLRNLARQHEVDRDTKEYYERLLTDIGKSIGCGHLDDRLPSCVSEAVEGPRHMLRNFYAILRHKNISPPMLPGVQEDMEKAVAKLLGVKP